MPQTSSPFRGATRRLLLIAVAAILALATLGVIPAADSPAHAQEVDDEPIASLSVEKSTNGEDADVPPGPTIRGGDPVAWTYVVTNDGTVPVTGIRVTDDAIGGVAITCSGQDNGAIALEPGTSIECSASRPAVFDWEVPVYANTATVTGDAGQLGTVSDTDPSHYTADLICPYGSAPGRIIVDITDLDPSGRGGFMLKRGDSVGPIAATVPAGSYEVSWASYDSHDRKVAQNQPQEIWRLRIGDAVSDATTDIPEGDIDYASGILPTPLDIATDQGQIVVEHAATSSAVNSLYAICAALDPLTAEIDITKTADPAEVAEGDTTTFTITVTNTGEVPLGDVTVDDPETPACDFGAGDTTSDPGGVFDGTLDVGESIAYTCESPPLTDAFVNTATATGTPPFGPSVTDTDETPVGVISDDATIGIDKRVWDELGSPPAWEKTGTLPANRTTARWQIAVTNSNTFPLSGVTLTDEDAPACETAFVDAAQAEGYRTADGVVLPAGTTLTFECESSVAAGAPGTNTAVTRGLDPNGRTVGPAESSASFNRVGASGTIGDTVWSDENANGVQDAGEKGIANARVRLTLPDGSTVETTTNSNGLYLFSALPAGTYKAELILGSIPEPTDGDLALTTPGSFTVTLGEGESFLDADFGVVATLPKTGVSTDQISLVALVLMAIGVTTLTVTRRRDDGDPAG